MTAYNKAPIFLHHIVSCTVVEAARRTGIHRTLPYKWLVESRMGKAELQQINFCDVVAPFHQQWENALAIAAKQAEREIMNTVRDGGRWVPTYKDGNQVFKRLSPREMKSAAIQFEIDVGLRDANDDYVYINNERVPELQFIKADAQTSLRMLEAWNKRYRNTQQIDVTYKGVLRLPVGEAKKIDTQPIDVEHREVFSDDEDEQQRPRLALAEPAKSSKKIDEILAADPHAFDPTPVKIYDEHMNLIETRPAARDPLLDQQEKAKADAVAKAAAPSNPLRNPAAPLRGDTDWWDAATKPELQPGTLAYRMDQANPYRDRSKDQRKPTYSDPTFVGGRGEQHRGFKRS